MSVDLAFQRVQEPVIHGISLLVIFSRPACQRYAKREDYERAGISNTIDG